MATSFIAAYWKDRPETRSGCAARYANLIVSLRKYPDLECWFFKLKSAKQAPEPVPVEAKELERYLRTNNRDTDGASIPELGFTLSIWNGKDDGSAASLSIKCGGYDSPSSNWVLLDMPGRREPVHANLEEYRSLLRDVIDHFDPDEAVLTSEERMGKYSKEAWPYNGYLNYKKSGQITEGEPD